jgi:hypothetical protein
MPAVFLCQYTADDGLLLNIELDSVRGHAGAFPAGSNTDGPPYPIHGKFLKVRGVYGRNGTKKMFLPCATNDQMNALYAAGTFTAGLAYTVTGKRGEHDTTAAPLV